MNYFFDCEFIEGFHKPLFGKRRHFIDLISIGILCEDGREYYAISNEYRYKDADDWVKQNVILKIYREQGPSFKQQFMSIETFHKYIPDGKSLQEIKNDLINFITKPKGGDISLYGYYADYDHVLLCSLFGTMIKLPSDFPMYTRDLKQTLDEKALNRFVSGTVSVKIAIEDIKKHANYPKQYNEHNALADAKWNYELYKFLQYI